MTGEAQNPFYPKLTNSNPLNASVEQQYYINEILKIVCSDSQMREKAILGLVYIMNGGTMPLPIITSLSPSEVTLGQPSFDLHVIGTNFTPFSTIVFNGFDEPTTFISPTELTTGVNMPLWQAPVVVPITVKNAIDVESNAIDFSFLAAAAPEPELASVGSKTLKLKPVNEPMISSKKESK